MNWHLQLPKPSLAAGAAAVCRLAFAAVAFTMSFPTAALAWQRQDLKDPFSGNAYSRLTQPAAGNFAVTGIAAGVPQLGLECDVGDNGRRSLSADISFPVAIDRESFVQLQYQFDGNRPVTELGRLLRPWHRLDFTDHSFAFIQPMLTASQVRMQFLLRGRGSPVLSFDLSDHAAVRSFVTACYPDVALVPPHVAPRVAEFLLQEGPAGITGLQTALHDLRL